jgi:hypothetical protein
MKSNPIQLKGGYTATDPRLGRIPSFDERSRSFNIAEVVSDEIHSKTWPCSTYLDQGNVGSCVGNGWSHELAAVPVAIKDVINEMFALGVYHEAQKNDEWPGENYEGTSVLAGAKVIQARGYMSEYRWAFNTDDALRSISQQGPGVVGTNWLDTMFEPDPNTGLLDCSGSPAGGHCYLVRGNLLKHHFKGVGTLHVVRIRNSWSKDWGQNGDAFIRVEDFDKLLQDDGEFCVPIGRRVPDIAMLVRAA